MAPASARSALSHQPAPSKASDSRRRPDHQRSACAGIGSSLVADAHPGRRRWRRGRTRRFGPRTASPATTRRIAPRHAAQHQVEVARRARRAGAQRASARRRRRRASAPPAVQAMLDAVDRRGRRRAPSITANQRWTPGNDENGPSATTSATLTRTRQASPAGGRAARASCRRRCARAAARCRRCARSKLEGMRVLYQPDAPALQPFASARA